MRPTCLATDSHTHAAGVDWWPEPCRLWWATHDRNGRVSRKTHTCPPHRVMLVYPKMCAWVQHDPGCHLHKDTPQSHTKVFPSAKAQNSVHSQENYNNIQAFLGQAFSHSVSSLPLTPALMIATKKQCITALLQANKCVQRSWTPPFLSFLRTSPLWLPLSHFREQGSAFIFTCPRKA